ncbi:Methyltransferase domain-containing protein [Natrinema hispanicum]|uniref:Methyltransferase domain-containing protein n=2 Tax=Natrinema hispanicum TaxID=392421 RepID=A0A1G6V1A1_9EURY|nr:Methyltransferase domain-containing protein [Natrinema hispanicum]
MGELKDLFNRWAMEDLDQEMATAHRRTASDALDQIPLSPGDRVLDIGTGNGFAARILASQEPRAHVYGIDLSPEMVRKADLHEHESNTEYVVGDLHSLPVVDNVFEYVFMMDVIQYSPNPEQALSEVRRVIKPNGQLYCANLFYEEVVDAQPELADREGIHQCWSEHEFRDIFRVCGFSSVQQSHIPDMEVTIPSEEACKQMGWESRTQAETVYRELGTLLTIGAVN